MFYRKVLISRSVIDRFMVRC